VLIYIVITAALAFAVYVLRRRGIAKVLLLLLSFSLCFTLVETYFRFFYVRSDGFARLSKNFADHYYKIDRFGLRASNLPPSEEKQNVVVLGDSHVFGAGLKQPAERLSEQLAMQFPELHVINLGYPGWDTGTQTEELTSRLGDARARIPLIVLAYFFNDIEEDVTPADRERLAPAVPPEQPTMLDHVLQKASNHSRFVELFYYRIGYPRLVRERLEQIRRFYNDPQVQERHLSSLERLREVARERYSANLLVILLPYLHSKELLNDAEFYARFREALNARGIAAIDLQPVFAPYGAEKLIVHRFDPHTNAFANQLAAKEVVSYLEAHPEMLQATPPSTSRE
jgi:hypothetical protein